MKQHFTCLVCLLYAFSFQVNAQSNAADSAFYSQSVQQAVGLYMKVLGESSNLYNGAEYIYSSHGVKGHPFFATNQLQKGTVEYNGTKYPDVPMLYDLVQDKLFITDTAMNFNIQLNSERIRYFVLNGHTFMSLQADSINMPSTGPGFYDLIYDGKLKVLVKRTKRVERAFKAEDSVHYVQYSDFFIRKNNVYSQVDGKKSLFSLFKDEKDKVRKYFRKNKLNFRKDPENAIILTTDYYAQLKN